MPDAGHQVDGIAPMVGRPTPPALVPVSVTEHGDGGVVVIVVGYWAVPLPAGP